MKSFDPKLGIIKLIPSKLIGNLRFKYFENIIRKHFLRTDKDQVRPLSFRMVEGHDGNYIHVYTIHVYL